ncbi:acyl-CoA thioesterase [Cryptosporangium phraense]|uniref:Acyl-CoA thioesterase II n=1 Tax=Cryptosporangium phraense TaxID=2593070 RepID=A0A545ATU4_9ACTN|nr:acyl-CoA thioesterase domain-containing protein [Cryptosporangium phraense]TQS44746.1 acyl-CoA thioesterase II [Cryptosporangium phraense]
MDVTFAELVDLKPADDGTFLALPADRSSGPRIFGGQLVGQALAAAARTVAAERPPHSLHGHFLHAGTPDEPIEYRVTSLRDGRAQSVRQVLAVQDDPLFLLTASFAVRPSGGVLEHQVPQAPPIDPDAVPTLEETFAASEPGFREWFTGHILPKPIDFRFVERPARDYVLTGDAGPLGQELLVRVRDDLADDPATHASGLAYFSDMFLLSSALHPHRAMIGKPGLRVASLDHAVWFHGEARTDEWLRYRMTSDWAGEGRGLCRGEIFDARGRLIATVVQEGLIKPSA